MSVNYYAYTVLGARIRTDSHSRTVPAFKHDFPRDWSVDPRTGKKLWSEESGLSVLEELKFGPGLKIEVCEVGYQSGQAVVGLVLCRCQGEYGAQSALSSLSPTAVDRMVVSVQSRLREAGLTFEDAAFGIHAVMRVSP